MSKAAIKNFFENQRNVDTRRQAFIEERKRQKREERIKQEQEAKEAFEKEFSEIDFLLKRNWFFDEEWIVALLWEAKQDVFDEIVKQIATYPYDVQQAIFRFIRLPVHKVNLKVRELTDEDMDNMELAKIKEERRVVEEAWQKHVKETNPEAPSGELDDEYDDMHEKLQTLKKNLETAKTDSLKKSYVPPAKRNQVQSEDKKVIEITKSIADLEQDIVRQKASIADYRSEWLVNKRYEFENKFIRTQ